MSLSQLTIFKDPNQNMMLMQNSWSRGLNVLLKNPALQSSILKNVALVAGTNTINTLLGQDLQGWSIVRQRGPASIYDTQDSNPMPNLTLMLVSSAAVTVDILVF